MSNDWHRITVTNPTERIGDCSVCGPDVKLRYRYRRGSHEWACMWKHQQSISGHRRAVEGHPWCNRCGLVAAHRSQLDVHHRDGNHQNNDPANLEVLCANCHRLEHAGPDKALRTVTPETITPRFRIAGLMVLLIRAGIDIPADQEVMRIGAEILSEEAA